MPSGGSSVDDPHCQCSHFRLDHQAGHGACSVCAPTCLYFKLDDTDSASSSPDELCRICGHAGRQHSPPIPEGETPKGYCVECAGDEVGYHDFVPMNAEAAEPEAHEHEWSEWGAVYHGGHFQWRACACGVTEATEEGHECPECTPEPPARECEHPFVEKWGFRRQCFDCREWLDPKKPVAPPRRPPYAVAYALASGELYEVALPGDAVATVEHGVLKISHPEGVDRIVQVKPMEMQ